MDKSEWDGTLLPRLWRTARSHAKGMVIASLQGRGDDPHWWNTMDQTDRRAVVLHLCAVGSVSANDHQRVRNIGGFLARAATRKCLDAKTTFDESTPFKTFAACPRPYHHPIEVARREIAAYRASHPAVTQVWQAQAEIDAKRGMLYSKPNGGQRILPSVYTKLCDLWLRGNAVYQEPAKMNQGHLQNTVALLNESHGNLVDRMCHLLGKMHSHLGNRPDLQRRLEELHHEFEALQVDELYPIVELIASHIEVTEPRVNVVMEGDWLEEWRNEHR